jgi:hypothetical protein
MDDRPQDIVNLTQGGEVVGGLIEGAELGLATASLVEDAADAKREAAGMIQLGNDLGTIAPGARGQDGSLELHGGGFPDEQLQQGESGHASDSAVVGDPCR